jgi:GntR family transcriptional regulator
VQFHIQPDSDVPASKQLYDQLLFGIASRQFSPGHRLPSTRQLAMQTGLHRNTISKVYNQLETTGVVESVAGSGIYVKSLGNESGNADLSASEIRQNVQEVASQSLNKMLIHGASLREARELFLAEIDWRLRCGARVFVSVPQHDIGAGELMTQELQQSLGIPVQLVPIEQLDEVLAQTHAGTVVTSRYFISAVEAITSNRTGSRTESRTESRTVRVLPVDLQDYGKELAVLKTVPTNSHVGIVSVSDGILAIAEAIVYSMRGEEILINTCQVADSYKLKAIVRSAHLIVSDRSSLARVKKAIEDAHEDLMRIPKVVESESYVGERSISLLKRELGLL